MTYFDVIANNVNTIIKRLDDLIKHLNNEYKKTPNKKSSQAIRKYANEMFDKIEKVEFLKMRLNNFLNSIEYIAENDLGKFNVNQIKSIVNIMGKMSIVIDNTKDNDTLSRFVNKVVKKMQSTSNEENDDNSVIELSIEEMYELKIGALVRYILKRLSYIDKFTQPDINNMQNKEWCKSVLKLYNPLIKKMIEDQDEVEQRKINGNVKYFQATILLRGERFFISNEMFEKSRESFIKWYQIKNDILQDINNEFSHYNSGDNNMNLVNKNDDGNNQIRKEEIDEIKQEYFSDPFKILNWLDKSDAK